MYMHFLQLPKTLLSAPPLLSQWLRVKLVLDASIAIICLQKNDQIGQFASHSLSGESISQLLIFNDVILESAR